MTSLNYHWLLKELCVLWFLGLTVLVTDVEGVTLQLLELSWSAASAWMRSYNDISTSKLRSLDYIPTIIFNHIHNIRCNFKICKNICVFSRKLHILLDLVGQSVPPRAIPCPYRGWAEMPCRLRQTDLPAWSLVCAPAPLPVPQPGLWSTQAWGQMGPETEDGALLLQVPCFGISPCSECISMIF